jgi:hypothetical protein
MKKIDKTKAGLLKELEDTKKWSRISIFAFTNFILG